MTIKIWEFNALDTLFFRDGTPHNAGEGGGVGIRSMFPPYIFTLQGAVKTCLALGQGWRPRGKIPFPEELGDGDHPGQISFEGPYIKHRNENYFPVPLHLLHQKLQTFCYAQPQPNPTSTDLGEVRLPVLTKPLSGVKDLESYLVNQKVLGQILAGKGEDLSKDDFKDKRELWQEEPRAGIAINRKSRTAEKGQLYFTTHYRTAPDLTLVVKVKGIEDSWYERLPAALSLGGEGRMAMVMVSEDQDLIPPMPELPIIEGQIKFTVTLITPGRFEGFSPDQMGLGTQAILEKGFSFVPGRCVSACVGKLKQVGGFDVKRRQPRPLIPLIPQGSTWFYEGDPEDIEILKDIHGKAFSPMGFNQILIGNWGYRNES